MVARIPTLLKTSKVMVLPSAPLFASAPQTIAPEESVSSESQDGRFVLKSLAYIPPTKVEVPAPLEVIASEVERWDTERPPVMLDVAEAVMLRMPLDKMIPSVIVSPPEDERPAEEMPPEKVDVPAPVTEMVEVEVKAPVLNEPVTIPFPSILNLRPGVVVPLPIFEYPRMSPVAWRVDDAYMEAPVEVANTSPIE